MSAPASEPARRHRAVVSLPSDEQLLVTREFDAPRALVFRAWTTPELIARWWTAGRGEVVSIEVDLRPGGRWRYVMTATAGFEVAFHGEYHDVVPDQRIVSTEVFEGAPDVEALSTTTFHEADGRTTVAILVQHGNRANRDMHLNAGMLDGLQDALDLVEDLLTEPATHLR
jgi:uncharacterized protein YndB with AHSA1/START domain